MNYFSNKNRPGWMGPFPAEQLPRDAAISLDDIPAFETLNFKHLSDTPLLSNSMAMFIAMLDTIREGAANAKQAQLPDSLEERARNIKGAGIFFDAAEVAICKIPEQAILAQPVINPDVQALATQLQTRQVKALASGIDQIMAQLREATTRPYTPITGHTHAIVFMVENPREVDKEEPGADWIKGCNNHRSALRAAEIATVLANYYRLLGFEARAHSMTSTDLDLNVLQVASGIALAPATSEGSASLRNPFVGSNYSVAAISTNLEIATDLPLASHAKAGGIKWKLGIGTGRRASTAVPYAKRRFVDGELAFETLKRVDKPTTFIDEERIPRVPKRADLFPRSQFGDFGKKIQDATIGGYMMAKSAIGWAPRQSLGAMIMLQTGDVAAQINPAALDKKTNAENIKAACYFLGIDAVGLGRCPDWAYYSHDAVGDKITPYHCNAISMMVDQGRDSMEGSSGDDWLSNAQSMRAYLRNSILGGVIAAQIRSLGYDARVHTVVDGEVLQPPLSLLSGLGEVSRIGEVILHPLLGPRLKTGVVTTNMPFDYDKPIDFGMQAFCERCNKCARECPSGAITAGPKTMFNGYEIWKSDSQKCVNYRLTNDKGSMCGRCMKTCPWNLEGLFAEKPFRWAASNIPAAAPLLAKLDDKLGHGRINSVKKWWWDMSIDKSGRHVPAKETNQRELQTDLTLKYEDQTLAVYPAHLAPHPWPFPFPADREAGIKAYSSMLSAKEHKKRIASGETQNLVPQYTADQGEAPVLRLDVSKVENMTSGVSKYEFISPDGLELPEFSAGAHLDVVVVPEFFRQYSLSGDPADRHKYQIGVLREDEGRGGSALLHRMFSEGRKVFVSRPLNHFPLIEEAAFTLLFGGGIGVTPMISMAHRLHALGRPFRLHYSFSKESNAGYLADLADANWSESVTLHDSSKQQRADLAELLTGFKEGYHAYTCGPSAFMQAVVDNAANNDWPEENVHLEYFSVPEQPEYVNSAFTLKLAKSNKTLEVPAERSAADVLQEAGYPIDIKCSDGICGVCKCTVIAGEVEHRDYVLSQAQRKSHFISCQSRAAAANGELELDL